MNRTLRYLLVCFGLAVAYVGLAVANREYSWTFGRVWLSPFMLLMLCIAPLCYGAATGKGGRRGCCR